MDEDARTVWCGNLADKVTEELLYELFLQAAPLQRVRIPTDKSGRKSSYGFITVKHQVSVEYVVQLLNGTVLYNRPINIQPRNCNQNQNNVQQQQQNIANLMPYNCGPQPHNGGERFKRDEPMVYKQRHNRQENHYNTAPWGNNFRNRQNYDRNRRPRYY